MERKPLKTGKMEDVSGHPAENCAKCGACTVVCPVYRVDGRESTTARGKMHLVLSPLAAHASKVFENVFSQCLLCGSCEQVCPRQLPITDIISKARSSFSTFYGQGGLQKVAARSVLAKPALLEGLVRAGISLRKLNALPAASGLRLKLGLLEERSPEPVVSLRETPSQGEILYFTGCLARHLQPSVATATEKLLQQCGLSSAAPEGQTCCGLAAWSGGSREQARELAKKNIEVFADSSEMIITSCASCSSHLFTYPDLFAPDDPWHKRARAFAERVREFTDFFRTLLPTPDRKKTGKKVFYHDPCHLKFTGKGRQTPRELLKKMGLQVVESCQGSSCCGQGGLFHLAYPASSAAIFAKTAEGALVHQPDYVTTTCSGCLMQYQEGFARSQEETEVIHLALLLDALYGRD